MRRIFAAAGTLTIVALFVGIVAMKRHSPPTIGQSSGASPGWAAHRATPQAQNLVRAIELLAHAQQTASVPAPMPAKAPPAPPSAAPPPLDLDRVVADLKETARLSDGEGIKVRAVLKTATQIAADIAADPDSERQAARYQELGEHARQALRNVVPKQKEENVDAYFDNPANRERLTAVSLTNQIPRENGR